MRLSSWRSSFNVLVASLTARTPSPPSAIVGPGAGECGPPPRGQPTVLGGVQGGAGASHGDKAGHAGPRIQRLPGTLRQHRDVQADRTVLSRRRMRSKAASLSMCRAERAHGPPSHLLQGPLQLVDNVMEQDHPL